MASNDAITAPPALVDDQVPDLHHHGVARWAGRRFRREMLNWRLALVRVLTSGVAVVATVAILPGLSLARWGPGEFLLIGLVFGVLNALLKPVLQFFTLRYLLPSYGLVVVLINAVLLAVMSWVLGGEITARGLLPFLLGGALVGVIGLILDTIFGAMPPILDRQDVAFAASEPRTPAVPSTTHSTASTVALAADPATEEGELVLAQADAVLAGRDPDALPTPPAAEPASPASPVPTSPDVELDEEGQR